MRIISFRKGNATTATTSMTNNSSSLNNTSETLNTSSESAGGKSIQNAAHSGLKTTTPVITCKAIYLNGYIIKKL